MTILDRVKLNWLKYALKKHDGNRTHAAKWLGVSLRTFRGWEIKHGLRGKIPSNRSPDTFTKDWKERRALQVAKFAEERRLRQQKAALNRVLKIKLILVK